MGGRVENSERATYRSALRHRDYRWLASSFVVSNVGSWAYNVALVVWVYERTGSPSGAAAASLARFVPAMLVSAYGGVVAERLERRRLIVVLNLINAALIGLLAVTMFAEGPLWLALGLAAASTVANAVHEPAVIALTPQIVGETDLAAANSLNSLIDNGAVVLGPALGAALIASFSPGAAVAVDAFTFVYAAVAGLAIRTRSRTTDVTEGGDKGPLAQTMVGLRALSESRLARLLAGFSVLASFYYGTDTVLFVVLSERQLGTGPDGLGYLLAGLGLGGVIAAPLINRLAGSDRLGTVIAAGMVVYTLPTAVMVAVDVPAVAFGLQVVRGGGTLVVDVLAITAIQRLLRPDLVARVYGVFVTLVIGAIALGSLVTPGVLAVLGLHGTLLLYGLGTPVAVLLVHPRLRRVDREAAERLRVLRPRMEVLRRSPLFSALARPNLEALAANVDQLGVPAGRVVIREGDPADAVYVIVEGAVNVSRRVDGTHEHLNRMEAGDYFGEIGLLEQKPRAATCTAAEDAVLYRIDGETFLESVNDESGTAFRERAVRRATTHRPAANLQRSDSTFPPRVTPPWRLRFSLDHLSRREREDGRGEFLAATAAAGMTAHVELLSVRTEPASGRIAGHLGVEPGTPVVVRRRRYLADGSPVEVVTSVFPAELAVGTALVDVDTGPGGALARLEELGHRIAGFSQEITARRPTTAEAVALDLPDDASVLVVVRRTIGSDGRALEVSERIQAGDRTIIVHDAPAG